VEAKPVCVQHVFDPWIRASLDGFVQGLKVLEIKAPKALDHDFALNGLVPPHYRPQIQWQMWCSGVDDCDYFSYNPSKHYGEGNKWACVPVKADSGYQLGLVSVAKVFWELVLQNRREMAA